MFRVVTSSPGHVDPDCAHPDRERPEHVGLVVVAHHETARRRSPEGVHHIPVDAGVGLPRPELSFELDVIEVGGEGKALDLLALHPCGSVGDEGQAGHAAPKAFEEVVGAIVQAQVGMAKPSVELRSLAAEGRVAPPELAEQMAHDLAARLGKIDSAPRGPRGIRPEPSGALREPTQHHVPFEVRSSGRDQLGDRVTP